MSDDDHNPPTPDPYEPDSDDGWPDVPQPGSSWRDVPLDEVVRAVAAGDYERPAPTLVAFGAGRALLYPGRVHGIHGIGGAGKTWLAALALGDQIGADEHVVFVDLEDTPATLIERLVIDLRIAPDAVQRLLHYKAPTEPSEHGAAELRATVLEHRPTLVVLDSVGEGLANDGVKQNEDDEVARWMRRIARSIADLGPAVLLIDHVPKSDEATLMPIGSQRKQAAMNGIIYSVQVKVPFSRDYPGAAVLVCGKDRLGAYKRGEHVAEMHVTPRPGGSGSDVTLTAPAITSGLDGSFRPTNLMEKVSRFLEMNPGATKNAVRAGVTGKSDAKDQALAVLIAEEYVTTQPGPRRSVLHTAARRFRQSEDGAQSEGPHDRDCARALREGHGAQSLHRDRAQSGRSGAQCPLHPIPKPHACATCEQIEVTA